MIPWKRESMAHKIAFKIFSDKAAAKKTGLPPDVLRAINNAEAAIGNLKNQNGSNTKAMLFAEFEGTVKKLVDARSDETDYAELNHRIIKLCETTKKMILNGKKNQKELLDYFTKVCSDILKGSIIDTFYDVINFGQIIGKRGKKERLLTKEEKLAMDD